VPQNVLKSVLVALLAISVMPVASHAQSAPQQTLKSALHLDSYKTLRYQDKDGVKITASRFMELVSKGRSFSIDKNEASSVATLSINATTPAPPKKLKAGQSNTRLSVAAGKAVPPMILGGLIKASGSSNQFAGRPILLSFFFHDCIPCIQEIETLNKFSAGSKRVAVLAVTFESKKQAAEFSSKYGFTWPIAADSQKLIDQLGVKAYPTLVLLSADGVLLGARTGDLRSTSSAESPLVALEDWTQALLQKKHN